MKPVINLKEPGSNHYDWVSVGGGAAGFFGALNYAAGRNSDGAAFKALILESSSKTLAKVKVSGGGRCNVTHHCFEPRQLAPFYPRGSKELLSVFSKFQPRDTQAWFEGRGVFLKTEDDGRMFPISDESQTIIDCFEEERKRLGVDLKTNGALRNIEKTGEGFVLDLEGGVRLTAKHVLMATGSNAKIWNLLETLGHKIVSPVPSLFSFNIQDPRLRDLSGRSFKQVEVKGTVGQKALTASGPLLITHWGLSGPAILKFSSLFARELHEVDYKISLQVNFLPDRNEDAVLEMLKKYQNSNAKRKLKNAAIWPFPGSYWINLLKVLGVDPEMPWSQVSKVTRKKILQEMRFSVFETKGKTTNKEEFVTAGGVDLKEVDFRSMESRRIEKMYLAGEVLNIDGLTGGFNFQNAWSTSFVAAQSALSSDRA